MCRAAQRFSALPSSLLNLSDPYERYCLDEAGAWLLGQKDPPDYGGKRKLNGNQKLIDALQAAGGVRIMNGEEGARADA